MVARHLDRERLERAFAVVDEGVQRGEIPCGVLTVADGREVLESRAYSRHDGDAAATDSIFLIASITKPIVATAVMQLVETGRLTLNDPITRHIPEYDEPGKPVVTLWHLLTHTSGMEEVSWLDALDNRQSGGSPAAAYLELACRARLLFQPGTRYKYCSLSFRLLGEIVARTSGLSYQEYLHTRVCAPLGMVDTAFDPGLPDPDGARTAPVHGIPAGFMPYFISIASLGGGLWSTTADLVRFGQAFLHHGALDGARVLAPTFVDLMTREHTAGLTDDASDTTYPAPAHYGLGWSTSVLDSTRYGSPRSFGHSGVTGTRLWVDPEYDLVYVFLTNEWESTSDVKDRALQAVYGALI